MKFAHIGLSVTELNRAVSFYQQVFNLNPTRIHDEGNQKYAFLINDRGVMITLWQQSDQGFNPQHAGLHHLAMTVDSEQELLEVEHRAKAAGAEFVYDGPVAHAEGGASAAIFFRDPDGTRLEVMTPQAPGYRAAKTDAPSCGFF